jgi:hypothetical protein
MMDAATVSWFVIVGLVPTTQTSFASYEHTSLDRRDKPDEDESS